jgi:hypothetical protein
MFWPRLLAVDVPVRLGSERQAQDSPAALWVRQPCGSPLDDELEVDAPIDGFVVEPLPGDMVEPGVDGVSGVDGVAVLGFCVVVGGDVVGGGVVCAKLSGAAIRHAAAVTIKMRFMGSPPMPTPVAGPATSGAPTRFPSRSLRFSKL